ncbi:MAG: hypothetical protein HOQ02_12120 [Lysobacter sp.]|nr:hypothetical protein [Lysobacter sp.]
MRHLLPLFAVAALAGCGRAPVPSGSTPLSPGEAGRRIEWQGQRACADCDGIATRLVLREDRRGRDYALTETYAATGGGARFAEHGRWQRDSVLLRLQGDRGSLRWYALLPDGSLQPRDAHGGPLPGGDDDRLVPVAGTGP